MATGQSSGLVTAGICKQSQKFDSGFCINSQGYGREAVSAPRHGQDISNQHTSQTKFSLLSQQFMSPVRRCVKPRGSYRETNLRIFRSLMYTYLKK